MGLAKLSSGWHQEARDPGLQDCVLFRWAQRFLVLSMQCPCIGADGTWAKQDSLKLSPVLTQKHTGFSPWPSTLACESGSISSASSRVREITMCAGCLPCIQPIQDRSLASLSEGFLNAEPGLNTVGCGPETKKLSRHTTKILSLHSKNSTLIFVLACFLYQEK